MKSNVRSTLRLSATFAFATFSLTIAAHAAVTNIAWYRLGENDAGAVSGQVVNSTTIDFAGKNHLRRVGSPRYTNEVSLDARQIGGTLAVSFNGVNQFYSNAVVTTARNNFGIEAWVKTATGANGTWLIAHNGNAAANGWGLQAQAATDGFGNPVVSFSGELGGDIRIGSRGPSRPGAWTHVALVRDNGTSTFYVNGVASGSTNLAPATPFGTFAIAGNPQAFSALFPGMIDEVRIFGFVPGQFNVTDLLLSRPMVTTLPANGVAPATATINGSISSLGFPTTVWFEWGDSTNLNNITPPQTFGSDFTTTNFSQVIEGLTASHTFGFRAVATNNLGIVFGSVLTFVLGPAVETLPADGLAQTAATLNGRANPNGASTLAWFEYGFTTNYGNVTPPQVLGSGDGFTDFAQALTGLLTGVSYHFRAVGSNALGMTFGADQSFPRFAQQAYLKSTNSALRGHLGESMAMSGDTLVVGAREEGAAYVFVRMGDSWVQQTVLTDLPFRFGSPVAISGDTIVVGVPTASTGLGNPDAGAAYVFVRSGTNWSLQAFLVASNRDGSDRFGDAVSVSGDTIVVGAYGEDSSATGINGNGSNNSVRDAGAAYVFVRSGADWTQQAYLKASNTTTEDAFGFAVTVSGDTIVVGAIGEDSSATGINGDQADNGVDSAGAAYVFVRTGTSWTQQAYLKASNTGVRDQFGFSMAASGDTIIVGAPGEASNAAGINGNQGDNSAALAGAAYVFVRNGTNWTQQAYLKASNTDAGDVFGSSVGISGDTLIVGAPSESSSATGINGNPSDNSADDSGAAYLFARDGTSWTQQAYVKASNTDPDDRFGSSVAVSSDLFAVGARLERSGAVGINGDQSDNSVGGAGAAYVFGPPFPPFAEINVSFSGTNFFTGGSIPPITMVVGASSNRNFTIKNSGSGDLAPVTITIDGPDAAMFTVPSPPATTLAPGANTAFAVRLAPTSSGIKTATLHIASNDADENPFNILLSFRALGFTDDQDGDGLSDAAEFQLAGLGFDLEVPQTDLVNLLFSQANGAGLFTRAQFQSLNVTAPLVAKDPNTGLFKLTIGVEKATLLTNFVSFPLTAPRTLINAEGKLEFHFDAPDGAAFFRLEAR